MYIDDFIELFNKSGIPIIRESRTSSDKEVIQYDVPHSADIITLPGFSIEFWFNPVDGEFLGVKDDFHFQWSLNIDL